MCIDFFAYGSTPSDFSLKLVLERHNSSEMEEVDVSLNQVFKQVTWIIPAFDTSSWLSLGLVSLVAQVVLATN